MRWADPLMNETPSSSFKPPERNDVIMLAGILLFISGIFLYSRPAAAIVLGLVLMLFAYVTTQPEKKKS